MLKIMAALLLFLISMTNMGSLIDLKETNPPEIASYYISNPENIKTDTEPYDSFVGSFSMPINIISDETENNSDSKPEDDNISNLNEDQNEKVLAFNENSEKTVGEVSRNAVENSDSLTACSEIPEGCEPKKPSPTPIIAITVIPTNTPTPIVTATPTPSPQISLIPIPDPYPSKFICPPPPPCMDYPEQKYDRDSMVIPCRVIEADSSTLIYPCPYYSL